MKICRKKQAHELETHLGSCNLQSEIKP